MKEETKDFLILFALLLFGIALGFNYSKSKAIELYEEDVNILEIRVDSLRQANDKLDSQVRIYKDTIAKYEREINIIKANIYEIRKDADKKINLVNEFTFPELEEFFSKRYPGSNKSTSSEVSNN